MKTKLETGILVIVLIIDICLLSFGTQSNTKVRNNQSTANYVEIVDNTETIEEVEKVEQPKTVVEQPVFDGLLLDELANKLDNSLNSTLSGKGKLIASYSIEKGVDPYLATAIILHETGCTWECSYIVKTCNNVGGQKGSGCGSYSAFNTLDEGIKAFIDNLSNNYISLGLTTPELINPKYAESTTWATKVNKYIETIKAQ